VRCLSLERNLVFSLLKLGKETPILVKNVKNEAKLTFDTTLALLQKLQNENLLNLKDDIINLTSENRVKLAIKAVANGSDIEQISRFLCWQEFEEIVSIALSNNDFNVHKNVRFTHGGRKWEIDDVGYKRPLVVCIDCKHWQRAISQSVLRRIVEEQIERVHAFADALPNPKLQLDCVKWDKATFIPAIISLMPSSFKLYYNVPIVPVLKIQDFLNQLPAYMYELQSYSKNFSRLSDNF
jgi:hypothetical protein